MLLMIPMQIRLLIREFSLDVMRREFSMALSWFWKHIRRYDIAHLK
jgi:hypothetical protein